MRKGHITTKCPDTYDKKVDTDSTVNETAKSNTGGISGVMSRDYLRSTISSSFMGAVDHGKYKINIQVCNSCNHYAFTTSSQVRVWHLDKR